MEVKESELNKMSKGELINKINTMKRIYLSEGGSNYWTSELKVHNEKQSIRSNAENIPLKESKNIFKTINRKGANRSIQSENGYKVVSQRLGLRKLGSDDESSKHQTLAHGTKHARINLFSTRAKDEPSKSKMNIFKANKTGRKITRMKKAPYRLNFGLKDIVPEVRYLYNIV